MHHSQEYRHILKGNEKYITKGQELTKDIEIPEGLEFSDAVLFQIGIGEMDISKAEKLAKDFMLSYSK